MILSLTGNFPLSVENSRPDTAVAGSKMSAAELVVGKSSTPCIIRGVMYGAVKNLHRKSIVDVSVMVFRRIRHTNHTKKGFVDVQITTKPVQFSVYIHVDYLENFFGACTMAMVRPGLNL